MIHLIYFMISLNTDVFLQFVFDSFNLQIGTFRKKFTVAPEINYTGSIIWRIFFRDNPLFLMGIPHKASFREINMALPQRYPP